MPGCLQISLIGVKIPLVLVVHFLPSAILVHPVPAVDVIVEYVSVGVPIALAGPEVCRQLMKGSVRTVLEVGPSGQALAPLTGLPLMDCIAIGVGVVSQPPRFVRYWL